jgi:hypothetical protein
MDPNLYLEVRRKQARVWDDLIAAVRETWNRRFKPRWTPKSKISLEDVLGDLAYGRD